VSLVVLLILAVVWAVFLVPQVLRARAEKTPADSIGAFRNQLSVLERATPGMLGRQHRAAALPTAPQFRPAPLARATRVSRKELVRRRRTNILLGLLGAMAVTLLLGLFVGTLLLVHLTLDLLFVVYCGLLVRARNLATEREMKVRYLPGPMVAPEPALLLRRAGS
jgi:hypothetical protein